MGIMKVIKMALSGVETDTYDGYIVDGLKISRNTFKNIEGYTVYAAAESSQSVKVGENNYQNAGEIFVEE